jgi:RNA polymerase sigma factor (TIGR02999 family)
MDALDDHFAAAYQDLRRLARSRLRGGGRDAVLDTTALVHESYLRLSQVSAAAFPDRPSFLVYAGKAMRSIIVDLVRERQTDRRGNDAVHLTLTSSGAEELPHGGSEAFVLGVHEALEDLSRLDPRMAQVVEMKYFAGMTENEIAEALGVTDRTVRRDWEQARLLLADALR